MFVNSRNTIYVVGKSNNLVRVWLNGDVYVDNGKNHNRIDKWTVNATIGKPVMFVNDSCQGLFVDIFGSIYCSIYTSHGVMKRWSADDINSSRMIAGNGTAGSAPHTLNNPRVSSLMQH